MGKNSRRINIDGREIDVWGSFADYLEEVKKNPFIVMTAHQRVFNMIVKAGIKEISAQDDPKVAKIFGLKAGDKIRQYNFFKDLYGIEPAIEEIVRYFSNAARGGVESRKILYFLGPVGSGKSSIVEILKNGLQDQEFFAIAGCPKNDNPLYLIPRHLREEKAKELGIDPIEGDLCPICRFRLKNDWIKDGKINYMDVPIEKAHFSIRNRRGIVSVPPVDPNSQDISTLIGDVDISKMDTYSENDPRGLNLNGAFNAGCPGIVEFVEVFKNPTEALHVLITATQEKRVQTPGKNPMVDVDVVIIAHSNEAEFRKFMSDPTNEAIKDRIVTISVPYVLELSEEEKIYLKILRNSRVKAHVAPYAVKVAAIFAILSRLSGSSKVSPSKKLELYNGKEVVEKGVSINVTVQELKEEARNHHEGMKGISTRFIAEAIDVAAYNANYNCINPIGVINALIEAVKKDVHLSEKEKEKLLNFLRGPVQEEFERLIRDELVKSFVESYGELAQQMFTDYWDNVEALLIKKKISDMATGLDIEPNVKMLESIEHEIGVINSNAEGFRRDLILFLSIQQKRGKEITWRSYGPLAEAIERKLASNFDNIIRLILAGAARDQSDTHKYNEIIRKLINDYGYCEYCVKSLINFARIRFKTS